jgi:hypothetical protein
MAKDASVQVDRRETDHDRPAMATGVNVLPAMERNVNVQLAQIAIDLVRLATVSASFQPAMARRSLG